MRVLFVMLIQLYLLITVTLYGISSILLEREAKRNNFKMLPLYGNYNAVLYYRELKKRNEELSKRFKFYLFATVNFFVFGIIFFIHFLLIKFSIYIVLVLIGWLIIALTMTGTWFGWIKLKL